MTQPARDFFTASDRKSNQASARLYSPAMKLSVSGHPLHTRSLSITTTHRDDGLHAVDAAVIDLRKCGFVPVAGFLQPSGIVHHMTLDATVDPTPRTIERFVGGQPTRAFEPSKLTRGECCGDPLPRLEALAGTKLGGAFNAALGQAFGGPLGCSHLVSLAQLLNSALSSSLDWLDGQPPSSKRWRRDERIFSRAVEIDGYEREDGRVQVVVQLTDVHFTSAPEVAFPMNTFGAETEVRISAIADVSNGMNISSPTGYVRSRELGELGTSHFVDYSDTLQFLEGQSMVQGISKRLLDAFPSGEGNAPLRDALLMMAPGYIQCLASLNEHWPQNALANPSLLGVCGRANSCYMWRDGGPVRSANEDWDLGD